MIVCGCLSFGGQHEGLYTNPDLYMIVCGCLSFGGQREGLYTNPDLYMIVCGCLSFGGQREGWYTNPDLYMIVRGCLGFGGQREGEVGGGVPAIAVPCTVVGDLVGTALMEVHPTPCNGTVQLEA